MNSIAKQIMDEALERQARVAMTRAMQRAAAQGASGRDIAAEGLRAMNTPRVMQAIQAIPSWTRPLLGTAIGSWLQKSEVLDRLLPGDNRPGIKEARFILKNVAPHLVIGATEALADIEGTLNRHVSSTVVPEAQRQLTLDWVVVSSELPGKLFIPARDGGGAIRDGGDGVPFVADREWQAAKRAWDRTHTATTRRGQRNQQVRVPAQPFPHQVLPLSDAIDLLGDSVPTTTVDRLTALLRSKGRWSDDITDQTWAVMAALSLTKSRLGNQARDFGEDLFEDLTRKGEEADINVFNQLGVRFHGWIRQDGTFSLPDYRAVVEYVDDWAGAELSLPNKLWRAYTRSRGEGNGILGSILRSVGAAVSVSVFAMMALFVMAFIMFLVGSFMDVTPSGYNVLAAMLIICGCWTMMILLALCKPIQALLNPIFKTIGASEDWLVDYAKRFSALLGIYGGLAGVAVLFGAPIWARVVLAIISMFGYGIMMGLSASGFNGAVRLSVLKGAKWLARIMVVLFALFLGVVLLSAIGSDVSEASRVGKSGLASLIDWVRGNMLVQAAIVLAWIAFAWAMVTKKFGYEVRQVAGTQFLRRRNLWFVHVAFILIAILAVGALFVKAPNGKYDPFNGQPASAATTSTTSRPAPTPPAPVSPAPVRHTSSQSTTTHKVVKVVHAQRRAKKPLPTPCADLSYELRSKLNACK